MELTTTAPAPHPAPPREGWGYIRGSTVKQKATPAMQRAGIDEWAAENNVVITAWYEDLATKSEIPFQLRSKGALLLHDLRSLPKPKRPRFMVCYADDRFERDPVHAVSNARILVDYKVLPVMLNIPQTMLLANGGTEQDMAELLLFLGGMKSRGEKLAIRRRTRDALQMRKAQGRVYSGKCEYGMMRQGDLLVPEPSEQAVIHMLKEWHVSGTYKTWGRMATVLDTLEIAPREGGQWQRQQVQRIVERATGGKIRKRGG